MVHMYLILPYKAINKLLVATTVQFTNRPYLKSYKLGLLSILIFLDLSQESDKLRLLSILTFLD